MRQVDLVFNALVLIGNTLIHRKTFTEKLLIKGYMNVLNIPDGIYSWIFTLSKRCYKKPQQHRVKLGAFVYYYTIG